MTKGRTNDVVIAGVRLKDEDIWVVLVEKADKRTPAKQTANDIDTREGSVS